MDKQSSVELGLVVVKRVLEKSKVRFDEIETHGSSVIARVKREGVAMQVIVAVAPKLEFFTTFQLDTDDEGTEIATLLLQGLIEKDAKCIRATFALAA